MKMRIKGDSLRLRVSRSEVRSLLETGQLEEKTHLGLDEEATLSYALMHSEEVGSLAVRYQMNRIAVLIPTKDAVAWAEGDSVGVYGTLQLGDRQVELSVEKDFACLDRSDAENADTFPNPKQGRSC